MNLPVNKRVVERALKCVVVTVELGKQFSLIDRKSGLPKGFGLTLADTELFEPGSLLEYIGVDPPGQAIGGALERIVRPAAIGKLAGAAHGFERRT